MFLRKQAIETWYSFPSCLTNPRSTYSSQLFIQLVGTSCTPNPEQIKLTELEGYSISGISALTCKTRNMKITPFCLNVVCCFANKHTKHVKIITCS